MWKNRCYFDGIPDEIPELLSRTNRVPSWKKIAICLLKNDLKLRGVGFTESSYDPVIIKSIERMNETKEPDLFS